MANELTATINLDHGLPAGFTTRAAVHDDLTPVTDLTNAASQVDVGAAVMEEHEVLNDWGQAAFDMALDSRVVISPAGQIIGYGEHWSLNEPRVQPYVFTVVHPDFRTGDVERYLLAWGEARARQILPEAPPQAQFKIRTGTLATRTDYKAILEAAGFEYIRSFFRMRIDMDEAPPAPVWPEGVTVRTLRDRADDLRRAFDANEEAFEDHWGHMPIAFETVKHWIDNDPEFDETLHFLAVAQTPDGEEIAGTCFCKLKTTEDPRMAWVDDLGVRRPWRRMGIAQALLRHAFGEFWRRGQRKAGLGVDASSLTGATRLYEKVGMRPYRQFDQYHKILRPGIDLSTQALER